MRWSGGGGVVVRFVEVLDATVLAKSGGHVLNDCERDGLLSSVG